MLKKTIFMIIAAVLVVGFAFGAIFGGGAVLSDRSENDWVEEAEPSEVVDSPDEDNGFEKVRPQLEQQLRQQRENEIVMEHGEELRDQGDIELHLDAVGEDDENAVIAIVNGKEILREELMAIEEQKTVVDDARDRSRKR